MIRIEESEVDIRAIRAQGAGGQHVNKVATAIHLRFDIGSSSLPEDIKHRLRALRDGRISADGVLVLKAQRFRSQDRNRLDAMARLYALVESVAQRPKARKATRPTLASRERRAEGKRQRATLKALRGKVMD